MKKLLTLILAVLMLVSLAACAAKPAEPTEPASTEPETQRFTIAPADDTELEWSMIDCDLSLLDENEEEYATAADFECFAIDGDDDNACLLFKPTEELRMMIGLDDTFHTAWYLSVEGENVGELEFEDGEFSFSGPAFDDLCALANLIRGVGN